MPDPEDVIHVSAFRGVTLVRFRGDIRNEPEVDAMGRGLLALADEPGQRIVLSFLGVRHLTSLVLGRLIQVHKRLGESGGEIRLADIDPQIYEVFRITHLDRLFEIHDREDDAIASFAGEAEG